ncbi:MAG TPA: hypothetical protein VJ505_06380 [Holophagaceae bacterium]|nr:hypothetical protein [Geothrix sp.]HJW32977.1 hypothetical protein [Holophagaceae bacterium]
MIKRLFVLCLFVATLRAQSYQTSFTDVGVDRIPGSFRGRSIYSVDTPTGALLYNIPIGSGIGNGAIHYTPTITGRIAPQLSYVFKTDNSHNYLVGSHYMSLLPGNLDLKTGPALDNDFVKYVSSYSLWNGVSGTLDGPVNATESKIDGLSLLRSFGYKTEVVASMPPFGLPGGNVPFMKFTSSGDIFIALNEPTKAPLMTLTIKSSLAYDTPSKALIISNGIAYEFSTAYVNGGLYSYRINRYRLTSIRNKFDERIDFVYDGGPNNGGYTATLVRNDIPTDIKLVVKGDGAHLYFNYYPIPDRGAESYSVSATLGNNEYDYYDSEIGVFKTDNGPPERNTGLIMSAMYLLVSEVKNNLTQETITIANNTYSWVGTTTYVLPTAIAFSSGKRVEFDWGLYNFRRNDARPGEWTGYYTLYRTWPNFPNEVEKNSSTFGIKSIKEIDGAQTRVTDFNRVVPIPNGFTSRNSWQSLDFYTAVIQPDKTVMVETYWPPVQNSDGGPNSPIADQLQTLAHLKHLVKEQRYYAAGPNGTLVDWQTDRLKAPSLSNAYKIVQYSGLDARRDGIPGETIVESCVPISTISKLFDLNTGVTETQTLGNWQIAPSFGWKERSRSITFNSNEVYQSKTTRTFSPLLSFGLFPRPSSEATTVQLDSTGGLDSAAPQTITLPFVETYFDTTYPVLNRVERRALKGGTKSIITKFDYQALEGSNANRLDAVEVYSTDFNGGFGIGRFDYDGYGRLNFIRKQGVTWSVSQDLDGLGRPTNQKDENGFSTQYQWDSSGRLTKIIPAAPLYATEITYDPDFRGAKVIRNAEKSGTRYNGFGELVRSRREFFLGDMGYISHKVYGYDPSGRKVFESIWIDGEGLDTEGQTNTQIKGDRWQFDLQGRLTDHTDPNGITTHTDYNGLNRKVTVGYGSSNPISTTFTSDPIGRLIRVTDAMGQVTQYSYDPMGHIAQVAQRNLSGTLQQSRTWVYNELGWLTSLTQPESGRTIYSDFTAAGKPRQTVYGADTPEAKTLRTTYDSLGRVLTVSGPGVDQEFRYDQQGYGYSNGKLCWARSEMIIRELQYMEAEGRLNALRLTVEAFDPFNLALTYDNYGRVRSRYYPMGTNSQQIEYEEGRGLPKVSTISGAITSTFGYNTTHWGLSAISYGLNANTFFTYGDDQIRLKSLTHTAATANTPFSRSWNYEYDEVGRLRTDGENAYTYDPLGRLSTASVRDFTDGTTEGSSRALWQKFTYDAFGNRTTLNTMAFTNPSVLLPSAEMPFGSTSPSGGRGLMSYSMTQTEQDVMGANNHLPEKVGGVETGVGPAGYDAQGNLTRLLKIPGDWTSQIKMTYDVLGRVTSLEDSQRGVVEKYYYNDEGLRTVVETYESGFLVKKVIHVYNEARQLISVYDLVQE